MIRFLIVFLFLSSICYADSQNIIGGKTAQPHIIQSNGTSVRPRPYLNLIGGASCTDSGGKTVCDINDDIIVSDGITSTDATTIYFEGASVTDNLNGTATVTIGAVASAYYVKIDDTNFLLIDDTNKLRIQ